VGGLGGQNRHAIIFVVGKGVHWRLSAKQGKCPQENNLLPPINTLPAVGGAKGSALGLPEASILVIKIDSIFSLVINRPNGRPRIFRRLAGQYRTVVQKMYLTLWSRSLNILNNP